MKCENQMELTFPSQSRNEGFARAAVAAFAAQLDPKAISKRQSPRRSRTASSTPIATRSA